jgi:hypothetical protein
MDDNGHGCELSMPIWVIHRVQCTTKKKGLSLVFKGSQGPGHFVKSRQYATV